MLEKGFGNEILVDGGPGDDYINTNRGSDKLLLGRDGNDILVGGPGDEELNGGGGKDVLEGGQGRDTLFGEGEDDKILGGTGVNKIFAGDGNDRIWSGSSPGEIDCGPGIDTVYGEYVLLGRLERGTPDQVQDPAVRQPYTFANCEVLIPFSVKDNAFTPRAAQPAVPRSQEGGGERDERGPAGRGRTGRRRGRLRRQQQQRPAHAARRQGDVGQ